ncbi:divergent polysaccharide deacetylase family protein [Belnapia sp. T6]|uniref:Divergent polysaccharide deacetylase family protein n=1 Tax=Belnapia mucosa TaxID=2804532 RepID=A0ABS1V9L9_9PROT|nr:divergent polysaccharide deacetylase family protein [Belnapia mucosa]MBL6458354.1 divergent polysaccharide deacetylase family protein [Belnapia mucosa]
MAPPILAWRRLAAGWRALIGAWAALLLVFGGVVGVLAWLGPLPAPAEAAAEMPAPLPVAAEPSPPPAVTEAAFRPAPTPAAPPRGIAGADPALLEAGAHGPLPRIGADGRTSIRAYGRPFDRQEARPRVGLVIGGLGMNAALTEEAIRRLPGAVTLAFSPYSPYPALLLDQARARGMEVLLALPLEPAGYPLTNPGNRALLTGLPPTENDDRFAWLLSRFTGYVGAIGAIGPMRGERFAALGEQLGALQDGLRSRGLLYVDPRPGARGPDRAWGRTIDLVVDEPATRGEIEIKLAELERLARETGSALGYAGEASPVLIDRAAAWAASVESRGLVLAPVTALMRRPDSARAN